MACSIAAVVAEAVLHLDPFAQFDLLQQMQDEEWSLEVLQHSNCGKSGCFFRLMIIWSVERRKPPGSLTVEQLC